MNGKKKKVVTSGVALVLVAALALAGTFAWSGGDTSDGDEEGVNTPNVALHDDYDKTGVDATASTLNPGEKYRKIYVENTGTVNLFVRVKLNEYMQKGGKSVIEGTNKGNKETWPARYSDDGIEYSGTDIDKYVQWNSGAGTTTTSYVKGVKNNYADTDGDGTADDAVSTATPGDIGTTPTGMIYTMKEYNRLATKPADGCWVLDEDGYAYWSKKLSGDKATSLLLNTITMNPDIDDSYYYALRATLEAVTISDLDAWLHGTKTSGGSVTKKASDDACALLKELSGDYTKITPAMRATDPSADLYDKDGDGFLDKKEEKAYNAGLVNMTAINTTLANAVTNDEITIDGHTYIVLAKNTASKQVELFSKTMVTGSAFHNKGLYCGWNNSDIRNWLNQDFIKQLSIELQSRITETTLKTPPNYSDWVNMVETKDSIYLLTEDVNASQTDGNYTVRGELTDTVAGTVMTLTTAQNQCAGTPDDNTVLWNSQNRWWLRSPHNNTGGAGVVLGDTGIIPNYGGGLPTVHGVRPAFIVKYQ